MDVPKKKTVPFTLTKSTGTSPKSPGNWGGNGVPTSWVPAGVPSLFQISGPGWSGRLSGPDFGVKKRVPLASTNCEGNEERLLVLMSLTSMAPASVNSHSSWPWAPSLTVKKRVLPTEVRMPGPNNPGDVL